MCNSLTTRIQTFNLKLHSKALEEIEEKGFADCECYERQRARQVDISLSNLICKCSLMSATHSIPGRCLKSWYNRQKQQQTVKMVFLAEASKASDGD